MRDDGDLHEVQLKIRAAAQDASYSRMPASRSAKTACSNEAWLSA
jgi:hypothetical protein